MFSSNGLKIALKILTIIAVTGNILLFYPLFLIEADYSQLGSPPYEMFMLANTLSYLLHLFMAYGLWNLFLFLQKDGVENLKKFGVIFLSYTLLQVFNGVVSSVLFSWHLGDGNRVVDVGVDELTFIFVSFALLVIYLSNLLKSSK